MRQARLGATVLIVGSCVSLFGLIMPSAAADSSRVLNAENGHWYQRIDDRLSWRDAKAQAESLGGYLATITTQNEQDFVWNNLGSPADEFIWLGGTDEAREGEWKWITGETFWIGGSTGHPVNSAFTYWTDDNPSDTGGGQDYLAFFPRSWDHNGQPNSHGWWDDFGPPDYNHLKPGIVEWSEQAGVVPEPSLGSGLLGLAGFKKLRRVR